MRALLFAIPAALYLSACSDTTSPTSADFTLATDIQQTMLWIIDPAADVVWDSAGFIIEESGETDLAPTSDEAWLGVLSASATLAESGNLLMLPGRSMGADWNEYAGGLVKAGQSAMQAAQAKDAQALFDAGGQVYTVCRACHNQYWTEGSD